MGDPSDRYPKKVQCRHNYDIVIRLLTVDDIPKEIELYRSLDARDKAKLPHDELDPNYPKKLRRQMEDGITHVLGAWRGDTLVGSLALYRGSSPWIRHTASVVLVTHPKNRRYGIATVLFDEMIPLAHSLNIEKLYANLLESHREARRLLKSIGFRREATLRDHVRDSYGRYRNLRIYSMDLEAAHKAMEELMSSFHEYSG